jgi:hypothetical protein
MFLKCAVPNLYVNTSPWTHVFELLSLIYFCYKCKKVRQCTYNVKLRRVRLTMVAVTKNCSLNYPAKKSACTVFYRHIWPVRL